MRRELETGHHASVEACANAMGVTDSYFSRIVRLAYLAPDKTTAILDGRQPAALPPSASCGPGGCRSPGPTSAAPSASSEPGIEGDVAARWLPSAGISDTPDDTKKMPSEAQTLKAAQKPRETFSASVRQASWQQNAADSVNAELPQRGSLRRTYSGGARSQ